MNAFVFDFINFRDFACVLLFKHYHSLDKSSRWQTNWWYVPHFSQKIGFDISCKLSPKVRGQFAWNVSLFSGKRNKKKYISECHLPKILPSMLSVNTRGGWVRQRCRVSYITRASNWYWLTFGQNLLSLQQVREEGNVFIFSVSSLSFIFLSPLSLSFISPTISSISLLPFSQRQHKMTHKGWRVVKPQHNQ